MSGYFRGDTSYKLRPIIVHCLEKPRGNTMLHCVTARPGTKPTSVLSSASLSLRLHEADQVWRQTCNKERNKKCVPQQRNLQGFLSVVTLPSGALQAGPLFLLRSSLSPVKSRWVSQLPVNNVLAATAESLILQSHRDLFPHQNYS